MKLLVGIASHSTAKDYTHEKLLENMQACVMPYADVLSFGDRRIPGIDHIDMPYVPSVWSDDMVYESREEIRQYAAENNYDAFIWQGSDCYYHSSVQFQLFVQRAMYSDYDSVGALTPGRNRPDYAVARRFTSGHEQEEIPHDELTSGRIIPAGYPGTDAILIKPKLFEKSWTDWDYIPWYEFGPGGLCIEEFWCMKVIQMGYSIGLDTAIRTWHVHETGMAARWPNEFVHQSQLSWNNDRVWNILISDTSKVQASPD